MLHLGYIGFEEGGQLTEQVRRHPYSIILFDEIEKADSEVLNILLQILEDGMITDSQGKKINFKNTIIILTSNIGANLISNPKVIGFSDIIKSDGLNNKSSSINDNIRKDVMNEVKKVLNPEFLNRIDDIIIFNKLSKKELIEITKLFLNRLVIRMKKNNINIDIEDNVANFLVNDKKYNFEYGARPIRRIIQNKIENLIATGIIEKKFSYNDNLLIYINKNKVEIKIKEKNIDKLSVEKYNIVREKMQIKKI